MKKILFFLFVFYTKFCFSQIETTDSIQVDSAARDTSALIYPDVDTTFSDPGRQAMLDSVEKANDTTSFFQDIWSHDPQSPGRAALFSAVLPGLGQIYNGKGWKVPIVYAGLGTAGVFIVYNSSYYRDLKRAAVIRFDDDSTTIDDFFYASDESLLAELDTWKRYVDLSYIFASAVYLLNIIDAVVDAHLYDFDVSDDLTLSLDPWIRYEPPSRGDQIGSVIGTKNNNYGLGIQINVYLK